MAAIIFDFDGTIADSFEMVVRIIGDLTGIKGRELTSEEITRLRGLSMHQAVEELHVRPWKIPFLLMRGRHRMARRLGGVAMQPGLPTVINKLHAEGHQLFVVSSNSERNIRRFLKRHNLSKKFVRVYGGIGLLGKARRLRKIRRQNHLAGDSCWYVADEVRDVISAHEAGVQIVAVTWGFNTRALLEAHNPTAIAESSEELLAILENV